MNDSLDYQKLLETSLVITEPNDSYFSPVLNIRIRAYSWESRQTCKDVLSTIHWESLSAEQRAQWIATASGWHLVINTNGGSTEYIKFDSQIELDNCFGEMRRVFRLVTGR